MPSFLAGLCLVCAAVLVLPRTESHVFVVVPAGKGFSPSMDVMAVAGELRARGHHLYIAASDHDIAFLEKAENRHQHLGNSTTSRQQGKATFVTYPFNFSSFAEAMQHVVGTGIVHNAKKAPLKHFSGLKRAMSLYCAGLFSNDTAIKALKEARVDAVLSFGLPAPSDGCGCILSHLLKVPLVDVNGNPIVTSPPNTPQFRSGLTQADLKTWKGWLKNRLHYYVKMLLLHVVFPLMGGPWPAIRTSAGLPPLKSVAAQCRPALHLRMTTFALENPQPLEPGEVLLGPVSPRLPRSAAEQSSASLEIWEFLQGAFPDAGVVLAGFGSTGVFGTALAPVEYLQLSQGFSDLTPTRVLWALAESELPAGVTFNDLPLGPNVKVVPWVDYNDALGHPSVKAFITHCGVHSIMEAAFHGIPVIGVPFQNEQKANCWKMVNLGIAEICPQSVAMRSGNETFQGNELRDLIKRVISDPKYAAAAAPISAKMQMWASFRTPVQRAADEVEVLLVGSESTGRPSPFADSDAPVSDGQAVKADPDHPETEL